MKCEEPLAMPNEYRDGTVDPAFCQEFVPIGWVAISGGWPGTTCAAPFSSIRRLWPASYSSNLADGPMPRRGGAGRRPIPQAQEPPYDENFLLF